MTTEIFEIALDKYKPEVLPSRTTICNGRKKIISLTPEEIIRQALISFLTTEKGYPISRIQVEVPMSRFKKEASGRADLIIYDDDNYPICIIECKKNGEPITDTIVNQVLNYCDIVIPDSICIISGNQAVFFALDEEEEVFFLKEFPAYRNLIAFNFDEKFKIESEPYLQLPPSTETYNYLIDNAIIGTDTESRYFPFLVRLYNLFNSDKEMTFDSRAVQDLGLKFTKFGNSSGGGYPGDYRSFFIPDANSVVSFAVSSSSKGEGYPTNTIVLFTVEEKFEEKSTSHVSLQLRVDKNIELIGSEALIWHNGTITIGKRGAAKKQELLDFVVAHNPQLINNEKIYLGTLNFEKEIDVDHHDTKNFIFRSIEYALIRDKFRKFKKEIDEENSQKH